MLCCFSQCRKQVFRLFAGYLQIDGVRAQVDLIAPGELVARADVNGAKLAGVVPKREHTLACQVRQIDNSFYPIGILHPNSISV